MKLPDRLCDHLLSWAMCLMASRPPDFIVNGAGNLPYLQRWFVIPRNKFFNIYLHHFISDDEDRATHSHPWVNCTLVLDGRYYEHLRDGSKRTRQKGQLVFRRAIGFDSRRPRVFTANAAFLLGHFQPSKWSVQHGRI